MWAGHHSLKKLKPVGVFPKVTNGATSKLSKQAMQAMGLFAKCCDIDALIKNANKRRIGTLLDLWCLHLGLSCHHLAARAMRTLMRHSPHQGEKVLLQRCSTKVSSGLCVALFELYESQIGVLLLERQLGSELNTRQSFSENAAKVHQTSLSSRGLPVASKLGSI